MSLDLSSLQLKDIKYVLAVYRMRSFRKAAEVCDVTQATISGQVSKVEKILNVTLIERSSRRVEFTPSSKSIIEQFQKISDEFKILSEVAFAEQQKFKGLRGEFNIGVIPTFITFFQEAILPRLQDKFPKYTFNCIELMTNRIKEELLYKSLDFALVANHPIVEQMFTIPIGEDELVALINRNNPVLSESDLNLRNLKNNRIFLLQDDNCLRDQVIDICSATLSPELGIEDLTDDRYNVSTIDTLKTLVNNNLGVSVVPAVSLYSSTPSKVKINRIENHPTREISVVYDPESPSVRFYNEIVAELKKIYHKEYRKLKIDQKVYKFTDAKRT
ncbi:LysR substrate-binding domain-containing protein [Psittacicella hinzii]|uniref:HTH lysR-type domain-containing protein n=1 Tax=Psittacicella hinzii TaxID=2028575 RepID=A0A3A1YB34_9GAMM|nr:LysR substrate-binding domain-containing protein [Psittacicella hinzii]RIY34449.1 hypothetical protein CKF58_08160 [Psittacicella hinzii]